MPTMRVLLISTYELGHQPIHLASPAAALTAAGHEVAVLDLAVANWDEKMVDWADLVAFSTPMHTALRLAVVAAERIRQRRPDLPIAAYGLYAGVADLTLFDRTISGEYEPQLLEWVATIDAGSTTTGLTVNRGRSKFLRPQRVDLPDLGSYAMLEHGANRRLVGAIETSHGCLHRCAHCPLPTVYDGRIRIVPQDVVVADIQQLVSTGATHITFADPDFLNAPLHSLRVVEEMHDRWPELTYDATIKVEHLLRHAELIPRLVDSGCLFVVSAFETLNDEILRLLDKGHSAADAGSVVHLARSSGLDLRPTWLPFSPWTSIEDLLEMFAFIAGHDLIGGTDPVQMSIRLLVPANSLLADHPAFLPHRGRYDHEALGFTWAATDQRLARPSGAPGSDGRGRCGRFGRSCVREDVARGAENRRSRREPGSRHPSGFN